MLKVNPRFESHKSLLRLAHTTEVSVLIHMQELGHTFFCGQSERSLTAWSKLPPLYHKDAGAQAS